VATSPDLRQGPDRRKESRGGRRGVDAPGFSPLVLVADEDGPSGELCETILAKLNFAVARVDSIDAAVSVMATLLPDVVVARARDVSPIHRAAWPNRLPVVTVTDAMRAPDALVDAIRLAIRGAHPPQH